MSNITKNSLLKFLLLCTLCAFLTSCGKQVKVNSVKFDAYLAGLYSESEALKANNFAEFDQLQSFKVALGQAGAIAGDTAQVSKINWGKSSDFSPKNCEYENFWGAGSNRISTSNKIIGLSTRLDSIVISTDNFMNSNSGIIMESILSFSASKDTSAFFDSISSSFAQCSRGANATSDNGEIIKVPFANSKNAKISYLKPNNDSIIRIARDGLIHLEIFIKTKYSIVNFQFMVNDLKLSRVSDWYVFDELINNSIARICALENCQVQSISLSSSGKHSQVDRPVTPPEL